MFRRVLIANRGEIACRVIRTCQRLGVETVAVYSDADERAQHVLLADHAIRIGGPRPGDSYLDIDRIIAAARDSDAAAVHPGYGFLAENAAFANACKDAGIAFIGPRPETIELMGSKAAAKTAMAKADVPLVPGYHGDEQGHDALESHARDIGFPLMIKAAAGGGGKGMRIVREASEFKPALEAAQREADNAFGDDRVILERYVERPRHIEVQVFGDSEGNHVHLFERDCSSQRRYQKVIEEAPAPGLSDEARTAIHSAAVEAAKAVDYVNAGTVEFIVADDESFYFMEMNTRLQVEHPVTEAVTGLDLVEWQLRIAAGEPLPCRQEEIETAGHAIEVRIYAEDPRRDFLPSTGRIEWLAFPDSVRVDTGVREGDRVTVHYDPMIAKLIAVGADRQAAVAAMQNALGRTAIGGLTANIDFLSALLHHERFLEGRIHTAYLDQELDTVLGSGEPTVPALRAAAILELLAEEDAALEAQADGPDPFSPWGISDGWRPGHLGTRVVSLQQGDVHYRVEAAGYGGDYSLRYEEEEVQVSGAVFDEDRLSYVSEGERHTLIAMRSGVRIQVASGGRIHQFAAEDPYAPDEVEGAAEDRIAAPMPGRIVAIKVRKGDSLAEGEEAIVMEAMKMELSLTAPRAGRIAALNASEGDFVESETVLLELEPMDEQAN